MKIMLDAGHGYNTPGKRSPDGLREYEFNRAVVNYAKQLLEGYSNVNVTFSHSDQKDVSLQSRTNKANNLNVDVFVSIHANAFGSGDWNSASGIETYIHPSKPPIASQLAQKIQRNLVLSTGLQNRGVKSADFHVLRETKMDAVLVECGFMTNEQEVNLLRSETYRKTCAEAIVKALADQFRLQAKVNPVAPPSPAPKAPASKTARLYRVQVGAFQDKQHAEKLAAALREAGFEPYINHE